MAAVAHAAHYGGISPPTAMIDPYKQQVLQAQRLPVTAPRMTQARPVAASVAPAIAAAPSTSSKFPQLQNLPRFQPPVFEGIDGQLPRPDSPCSTPREEEQTILIADCFSIASLAEETNGPFTAGTLVEYKSRSSGQWITAQVESYDVSSQTYRLDVQSSAPSERVRLRARTNLKPLTVANLSDEARHSSQPASPNTSFEEEVESLRARVAMLETENRSLQEKVLQEAKMKDKYLQELVECHEQLSRYRAAAAPQR